MIASTTKYTLKNAGTFFVFAVLAFRSVYQANRSSGLITVKIRVRDLRTLTVWKSEKDMLAFRNSGIHRRAMIESSKLGSNQSHTWKTETIPTWSQALQKISDSSQHSKRSKKAGF